MTRFLRWLLLSFAFLSSSSLAGQAYANTINAASCNAGDVLTAITSAAQGDTVLIPSGTCSWTSTMSVTKDITIQGSGQGVTIIQDNVSKGGSSCGAGGPLFDWNIATVSSHPRLTSLTIQGVTTDPGVCQYGHIHLEGGSHNFRLDHITIDPPQTAAILIDGNIYGVIDHLTFNAGTHFNNAVLSHDAGKGYVSWNTPINYGSADAMYIEDSTFTYNIGGTIGNPTDLWAGARLVIRHSTFIGSNNTSHGADSGQDERAARWQEIYNNTYTYNSTTGAPAFVSWIRGGTGVFFNNTITTAGGPPNQVVQATNCRDSGVNCDNDPSGNFAPWGACGGTSPYDGNQSGQNGYRCVDQPGAGTSNLLTDNGGTPTPVASVGNINDPVYVWNNTVNGSPSNTISTSTHVQVNRDIFSGTARPGYTPYTYPHPLTLGQSSGAPAPPTGLSASVN